MSNFVYIMSKEGDFEIPKVINPDFSTKTVPEQYGSLGAQGAQVRGQGGEGALALPKFGGSENRTERNRQSITNQLPRTQNPNVLLTL